jgi:hypothetical protein
MPGFLMPRICKCSVFEKNIASAVFGSITRPRPEGGGALLYYFSSLYFPIVSWILIIISSLKIAMEECLIFVGI